jgi:HSP20 family protein
MNQKTNQPASQPMNPQSGQQSAQQSGQQSVQQSGQQSAPQSAQYAGADQQHQQLAGGAPVTTQTGTAAVPTQRAAPQRAASPDAVMIPPVDVIEDAAGITLRADLPGVSKEGLHLRLDADSLTIEGELTLDAPQQMDSRYAEVRQQHYQRTFALSRDLDPDQAVAELKHGVLTLRIPKARHAQPRKIDIKVG